MFPWDVGITYVVSPPVGPPISTIACALTGVASAAIARPRTNLLRLKCLRIIVLLLSSLDSDAASRRPVTAPARETHQHPSRGNETPENGVGSMRGDDGLPHPRRSEEHTSELQS